LSWTMVGIWMKSGKIEKMKIHRISLKEKELYNKIANHPLQSWEWGEFREKNGAIVERFGVFQVFFHKLPFTPYTIGYFPKGPQPTGAMVNMIKQAARRHKAILVKFEPNQEFRSWKNRKGKINPGEFREKKFNFERLGLVKSPKAIFDPHTFVLDISKSEKELLANMHHKTRYNIRLAKRKGVTIEEDSSQDALTIFIRLLFEETIKRQGFYMHTPDYFKKLWKILHPAGIARILLAKYKGDILTAWMLFNWKDVLYYPYGASSSKFRQVMASNLICWEAIRLGKKMGCKTFDMWGGLGPSPNPKHAWYGFHRFKLGYGGDLVENVGSWDLVINRPLYYGYNFVDKLRWQVLRLRKRRF